MVFTVFRKNDGNKRLNGALNCLARYITPSHRNFTGHRCRLSQGWSRRFQVQTLQQKPNMSVGFFDTE